LARTSCRWFPDKRGAPVVLERHYEILASRMTPGVNQQRELALEELLSGLLWLITPQQFRPGKWL
jgi:hypothetical protein